MRYALLVIGLMACGESTQPGQSSPDTVVVDVVTEGVTTNPDDPSYYWCTVFWTAHAYPATISVPYYAIVRTGTSLSPLGQGRFVDSVRHGLSLQLNASTPYPWTLEWNFYGDGGYRVWGQTAIEGGCVEGATTLGDT